MIANSNPKRSLGAGSASVFLNVVLIIVAAVGWYLFFDEQKQHLLTAEILSISEEAATQLMPTQDEVKRLDDRIGELQNSLASTQSELAEAHNQLANSARELAAVQDNLANANRELTGVRAADAARDDEQLKLGQARAEIEQELGKERLLHEQARAALAAREDAQQQLEQARAEIERELVNERGLHGQTRAALAAREDAQQQLEQARAEIERELVNERGLHGQTRAELTVLKNARNQLEQARAELVARDNALNQLEQARAGIERELGMERILHEQARTDRARTRESLEKLRAALATTDSDDALPDVANARIKRLEAELADAHMQGQMTAVELEKELQNRIELQLLIENRTREIEDERRQLAEQLAQEQARRKELLGRIAAISKDVEAKEDALSGAQQDVQTLSQVLEAARQQQNELLARLEQQEAEARHFAELKVNLEQQLNESRVQITQLKNRMTVINLTSEVLFGSGSASLKPAGARVLALIAKSLNNYPGRAISVEGHTDNVPIGRSSPYSSNWELSAARAMSAVSYLQHESNVDPGRLRVVGHGEYQPVAGNDTAKGRQANRRIEIRLLPTAEQS